MWLFKERRRLEEKGAHVDRHRITLEESEAPHTTIRVCVPVARGNRVRWPYVSFSPCRDRMRLPPWRMAHVRVSLFAGMRRVRRVSPCGIPLDGSLWSRIPLASGIESTRFQHGIH